MVRSIRRFPLMGLALFGLGFFLASALAGSVAGALGSAIGLALFLPLLLLKMVFMLFIFGAILRFFGGDWGRRHSYRENRRRSWDRAPRHDQTEWRYRGRPIRPTPPARGADDDEWQEHLRQARREVDDLDAPYNEDSRES